MQLAGGLLPAYHPVSGQKRQSSAVIVQCNAHKNKATKTFTFSCLLLPEFVCVLGLSSHNETNSFSSVMLLRLNSTDVQ